MKNILLSLALAASFLWTSSVHWMFFMDTMSFSNDVSMNMDTDDDCMDANWKCKKAKNCTFDIDTNYSNTKRELEKKTVVDFNSFLIKKDVYKAHLARWPTSKESLDLPVKSFSFLKIKKTTILRS